MYDVIKEYKRYLENDCRFTRDTVIHYVETLPAIFSSLEINSLQDIDSRKVSHAWRFGRWEPIQKGIQVSESAQAGYLLALKEFLRYLEDRGYCPEDGISEIIRIPEAPPVRLKGLNPGEQQQLRDFLVFNVGNDLQRKETALTFLLLATGVRLTDVLTLNVGFNGLISTHKTAGKAGDFDIEGEKVFLNLHGFDPGESRILLPSEALHYLNFYLENRNVKSTILFLNNARVIKPGRLTPEVAINLIERVLRKAGIAIRRGQAIDILRFTAHENRAAMEASLRASAPAPQESADASAVHTADAAGELNWQFPLKMEVA